MCPTDNYYENVEDISLFDEETDHITKLNADSISANDAFIYSMRQKGKVDLEYMERISSIEKQQLVNELIGKAIWPDPDIYLKCRDYYKCFVSRQQFLGGNLIKKYKIAVVIDKEIGKFGLSLDLLREALPEMVDPNDIHMNLGAAWIPEKYVNDFVKKLLEMFMLPGFSYNAFLGKWSLEILSKPNYVKNTYTYGTQRMPALTIIKDILNAKPVKVYDQIPKSDGFGFNSVLNKAETLAAQQKVTLILEEWNNYVHDNPRIEARLQELYMDNYGYSLCRYDGDFLELPDLNPEVKPYKHQKDAIARIILNHNTLLAHEVGAGKTLEYMCGVHELIRMKLGKKAMIVLPNTTFDAAVSAYKEFYPNDRILPVYPKKDFKPSNRQKILDEMMSDEYQVIFIAYSSFDMLTLSKEMSLENKRKRLAECKDQLLNANKHSVIRALETEKKRILKQIEKEEEAEKPKITSCFEKLGIDILVVDESHNYKNISLDTMTENIVGVHVSGSGKANNMLEKVEHIQKIGGHVIFATGTPITNSMADLYVLQRYLQPAELKLCHIYHFSDWVSTFCSRTHSFEVDVDSKNFRFTTRFSKFHNIPELMSMFSNVCDFYQISNDEIGLPDFDGYSNVRVKKSEIQRAYIDDIAKRTEDIRTHKVKRREDNLLKITVDGRKCALDVRLVVPDAKIGKEETKVRACAKEIFRLYKEYPESTQIAFSDISTPKDGFNIYDELKKELVKLGILENEIMYIHEATSETMRNKIEKRFNKGEIKVLIGSTMKLGTGSNVQERLIAIHHLDVPWRPADMVQREGRIIRQGNTNKRVFVFRYVTEASFDSYTWQILENKQRFIAQFLAGSLDQVHRDESDCADTVLNYAEIKALAIGNPMIKERVELANELEHAKINQRQKRKELDELRILVGVLPKRISDRRILALNAKSDERYYKSRKQSVSIEKRRELGERIFAALKENVMCPVEKILDSYQGFDIVLPAHMSATLPHIILRRYGSNSYSINMDGDKSLGVAMRIDYVLEHLGDTRAEHEQTLEDLKNQQVQAAKTLADGNEFDILVDSLVIRLNTIDLKLREVEAS